MTVFIGGNMDAVFYIDQSRIIFGKVGLSADVGIGLVKRVDFAENSLYTPIRRYYSLLYLHR